MRHLVCCLSFALLSSAAFPRAAAQTTTDTVYHLHGTVLNGVTGKPVGRALVVSGDRRLATMTNSEGNFALDVSVPPRPTGADSAVPRGRFSVAGGDPYLRLMAQRPGYLQTFDWSQVALDQKASGKTVVLRIMPAANIRGQVTIAGQESSHGVQITLLHRSISDGRYTWMQRGGRQVSPDGWFQIGDLQPGDYTVMTSEWTPGGNFPPNADTQATQQYPATFLGNVPTLAAATKLHVGYGETAQADLRLSPAIYYPVIVPVQGSSPTPAVNVRVSRGESFNGYRLGWNGQTGRVEGALPDGDYTLWLNSFGAVHASASVPLHVAGAPVQMAAVALSPSQNVPVHVHDERTGQGGGSSGGVVTFAGSGRQSELSNLGFTLFLRPEDQTLGMPGGGMQMRNGEPVVENLSAGSYRVDANGWRGYIASLTSGRTDLMRDPLVLGDSGSTDPIEVTLRDDAATVQGTVGSATDTTDPTAPVCVVLLVPADGRLQVQQSVTQPGTNQFTFGNVAPGSYRALVMPLSELREGVPYRDAEAMRAYEAQSVSVTATAGESSSVTLPRPAPDVLAVHR